MAVNGAGGRTRVMAGDGAGWQWAGWLAGNGLAGWLAMGWLAGNGLAGWLAGNGLVGWLADGGHVWQWVGWLASWFPTPPAMRGKEGRRAR